VAEVVLELLGVEVLVAAEHRIVDVVVEVEEEVEVDEVVVDVEELDVVVEESAAVN